MKKFVYSLQELLLTVDVLLFSSRDSLRTLLCSFLIYILLLSGCLFLIWGGGGVGVLWRDVPPRGPDPLRNGQCCESTKVA